MLRLASFPVAIMTGDFPAAEKALALLVDVATVQNGTYWLILQQFLRGELDVKRHQIVGRAEGIGSVGCRGVRFANHSRNVRRGA